MFGRFAAGLSRRRGSVGLAAAAGCNGISTSSVAAAASARRAAAAAMVEVAECGGTPSSSRRGDDHRHRHITRAEATRKGLVEKQGEATTMMTQALSRLEVVASAPNDNDVVPRTTTTAPTRIMTTEGQALLDAIVFSAPRWNRRRHDPRQGSRSLPRVHLPINTRTLFSQKKKARGKYFACLYKTS